ncbi:hypothetical protein SB49_09400 [Sediminicola sp. YIK13]|uniref:hypothetical protein n=1 Tax=Sediminicola sp. YIK13 TaxID=1453352 RepID=UPI00071F0133|nr:hypothetical protein [Sediminicola sp. YIK13]ALM07991.1 hypothetical protein SB49_09400 [Sediminicola sp. YIK13]
MKYFLILGFLLLNLTAHAQIELRGDLGDVYYSKDLYKTTYNSPEGSPYLNENFTPAKINDINETKLVRFNAYEDRIEVMVEENKVIVLPDTQTYTISLLDGSNKVFETKNYLDEKGNLKNSFFELIVIKEKHSLYLKEKIEFTKAVKAQGYQDSQPAMFKKQKESYFITDFKGQSDQLIYLPRKLKNFLKLFPAHSKTIKSFIKDNKLKIDKSGDLLKIFDFYFSRP